MNGSLDRRVADWFAARGRWHRLALAMLAGAAMTAGHPPVSLPWTFFLAMPVLVWLVRGAPSPGAAAWIGWGAGVGYFVTGLHWIGHAFLVDADKFAWLLPLGVVALPSALALFWALAFWAAKRAWHGRAVQGAILLAATLSLAEVLRSYVLTGFPWALPGYIWVDTPAMQAAAWAGPFGMTLLTLVLAALPLVAATGRQPVAAAVALGACTALWAAGAMRIPDAVAYAPDAPVLRIVQPNAPQHLKWLPGHRESFYQRTLDATAAPPDPALGPADLVIWPEMAVYFVPVTNPAETARIAEAAGGAPVILGSFHAAQTAKGERWTNALTTVLPDGRLGPRYDKHHLVPFGEYVPLAPVLGQLGIRQLADRGGFSRGDGPATLTLPDLPAFAALICYEAIFPYEVIGGSRPDWIVQITNDAWFGTFAGPQQHYAQARIRAIEQGLPIVRAANTGISAVVSPHGLEVASSLPHNYNKIDAKLPAPLLPTLYSRTGDLPVVFLIVFLILLNLLHRNIASRD